MEIFIITLSYDTLSQRQKNSNYNTFLKQIANNLAYNFGTSYETWFNTTVMNGIRTKQYKIILSIANENIAGYSIICKTNNTKKIEFLYVLPEYRNLKIGLDLLTISIALLGSSIKNIIVPEEISNYCNEQSLLGLVL